MIDLSVENYQKLSELIYRRSGIALTEQHFEKINKKLDDRCQATKCNSFRQYFFMLRFEDGDGKEFQQLINAITVNETYFFRENHQFEVMKNHLIVELDKMRPKNDPIRILSAPCSTGEEAYSIALHLLEEAKIVERRDIEIVAIDIDSTVIEKAKEGLYSDRSIHAIPNNIVSKYFTKKMGRYQISSDLKDAIDFKIVNVFNKQSMLMLGKFDLIFSRNMLIYFDDISRKQVALTFYDLLKPKGYIMLGHAEYMNRIVSVFEPVKFDNVLAYQKP